MLADRSCVLPLPRLQHHLPSLVPFGVKLALSPQFFDSFNYSKFFVYTIIDVVSK